MSGRARRRVNEVLTGVASLTFPRARRADSHVVRDCAREAVDAAGLRGLPRESISLAVAGLRTRPREAVLELRRAPWQEALRVLTLPLAAAILVVWVFGFIPRYDHWPLGEGWALLLGGSLLAVVGAALRLRWLTALAAAAVLVAAAAPYLGYGTDQPGSSVTPTFFWGYHVDYGAASLLPTLLLLAGALSLPARRPLQRARVLFARLAAGLLPAVIAVIHLLPFPSPEPTYIRVFSPSEPTRLVLPPPYPMPWIWPSRILPVVLGIALAVAVVVTWRAARGHPEWLLATGLVLASVAYPLVWVTIRTDHLPTPYWLYNGAYPLMLAVVPLVLALVLMRRAGRATPASG